MVKNILFILSTRLLKKKLITDFLPQRIDPLLLANRAILSEVSKLACCLPMRRPTKQRRRKVHHQPLDPHHAQSGSFRLDTNGF